MNHTYRGSFSRHLAVEKALLSLRKLLEDIGDACPAYLSLNTFLGIFFGLNCAFPCRDIALYVVWHLGVYKPFISREERWGVLAIPKELTDRCELTVPGKSR